ncbi:MAG: hypothetical protein KI790_02815 [Cyclobacteriaceae bacterium]|nr:hypothetical protein [Cyclobacteriaceae bacterium HetDA_MAG_MS6]
MNGLLLDILFCLMAYSILLAIIIWKKGKKEDGNGGSNDDDGGLPVLTPPELDLPPGVCLPIDGPRQVIHESDEVLA